MANRVKVQNMKPVQYCTGLIFCTFPVIVHVTAWLSCHMHLKDFFFKKQSYFQLILENISKADLGFYCTVTPPPPPFHWTAIPLRSWRSRIFSKIIPNRRGSVDRHTIWGLDASSTLPVRFYYASVTLLLRSHYDNENLATLSLR